MPRKRKPPKPLSEALLTSLDVVLYELTVMKHLVEGPSDLDSKTLQQIEAEIAGLYSAAAGVMRRLSRSSSNRC